MEEGMVAYRRAIAIKPDYAAARSNLGLELRKKGLLDEAIASCREATRLKPNFAQARGNLGSALGDKGLWDEAVAEFKEAIRLEPDFVEARNGLGILLSYEKGDHAAAVKVFRDTIAVTAKLVRDFPDNGWYRHHRAGAHYHLGRLLDPKTQAQDKERAFREAVAIWQQLTRDFPDVPEYPSGQAVALHDLAAVLGERGAAIQSRDLSQQAVQLQQAALAREPRNPHYRKRLSEHHWSLAHALIVLKEHAGATAAIEELIKVAPESWQSYYEAAQVYTACANLAAQDPRLPPTKRNELLQAHAHRHNVLFREAAERKPDQAEAQTNLAWFLTICPDLKFRNPSLALELAEKAVKPGPPEAIPWAVLGAAYYRAGQWQKALAALEKSLQLHGNNDGPALFFLAMTQWQRGDKQRARQRYEQGVQELAKRPNDGHLRGLGAEAAKLLGPPKQ
jgi:tetratricopeptide (TPR) repeat protein